MRRFYLLLIALVLSRSVYAIRVPVGADARYTALGNIQTLGIGFGNVYGQSAALAWHKHTVVGTTYTQGYFSDKNLSTKSVGLVLPVHMGTFGLQMQYFGFADYHEQFVGLSFGKRLGKHWAVGVQIDYFRIAQGGGYGNAHAVSADISLYAQLSKTISLGARLFNPVASGIGASHYKEPLPVGMQLGVMYMADKDIALLAEVENRLDQSKTTLKLGIEYRLHPMVYVRAGFSSSPQRLHAGFGWRYKAWRVDMATIYHQSLGFNPCVSLSLQF